MNKDSGKSKRKIHQLILDFCRHLAGSAQITAISLLDNYSNEDSKVKMALETVIIIHNFQPRLMSYTKIVDGKRIFFFAVDQWIFERDADRGFLGEALAGTLIFPHKALSGKEYLHEQEIILKKRLIRETMQNLVLSFPELSTSLHIKPKYFMYEIMLNRIRIFPPLAYGLSNFMNSNSSKNDVDLVFKGYAEALKQLEKEKKIIFSDDYIMIPKKFITESKKPKVRLTNLSKSVPRTLFTTLFAIFPQLLNFFSQNTEPFQKISKLITTGEGDFARCFVNPQEYIFVPTAGGLVAIANRIDIDTFVQKMILNGEKAKIEFEPVGGVLNDVYLIKAHIRDTGKKVIVKRFKDWSGFKWFPLSLWSLGARNFAVLGRSRLERECATSELLRREGFNVPKILHVSHKNRLVFMECIDGENLSYSIKRIAKAKNEETCKEDLDRIMRAGEIFAHVHSFNVALGDTKPENLIFDEDNKIYLLDFEQSSQGGDKAWDVAEFLYYSGHYLPALKSKNKAKSITNSFINGYLKGGGDFNVIKRAGNSKYTRVFSVFVMPSIIMAISDFCRKTQAPR